MNIDRHKNSKARKAQRREEALARQAESAKLTPQQRLNQLDKLFGVDKGATRERLRLHNRLRRFTPPTQAATPTVVTFDASVTASNEDHKKKQRRRKRDEKRGA